MKQYILSVGVTSLLSQYVSESELQIILGAFVSVVTVFVTNRIDWRIKRKKDKDNGLEG